MRPPPNAGMIGLKKPVSNPEQDGINIPLDEIDKPVFVDTDPNVPLSNNFEKVELDTPSIPLGTKRGREDEDENLPKPKARKSAPWWSPEGFTRWLIKQCVDNSEIFTLIIGEIINLSAMYNPWVVLAVDLAKKSVAQYTRVLYYTWEETPWLEGEGYWSYIKKLGMNIIENTGYFLALKLVYFRDEVGAFDQYKEPTEKENFFKEFIKQRTMDDEIFMTFQPVNNTILTSQQWKFIMEGNKFTVEYTNALSLGLMILKIIELLRDIIPRILKTYDNFSKAFGRWLIKVKGGPIRMHNAPAYVSEGTSEMIRLPTEQAVAPKLPSTFTKKADAIAEGFRRDLAIDPRNRSDAFLQSRNSIKNSKAADWIPKPDAAIQSIADTSQHRFRQVDLHYELGEVMSSRATNARLTNARLAHANAMQRLAHANEMQRVETPLQRVQSVISDRDTMARMERQRQRSFGLYNNWTDSV